MKNVEDVYPLSPMQQGMLFHTLYAPGSGAYVVHISCTMLGALDIPAFKRAWQTVLQRHPILRSAFLWERLDSPLQVVRQQVELNWNEQDWRELSPATQKERLDAYLWDEHLRGFDLSKAPLLHLTLFRLADDTYQFIWHYSHLLLDGWSVHLVFHDLFTLYQAYAQGRELKLPRPRPYRDYIGWLQRQELSKAEEFWRRTLKGFTTPTPLSFEGAGGGDAHAAGGATYDEIRTALSASATARLQSLARSHKLTLNTFVQGAWALLLSRYSGEDDLVFGVTVTGRPVSLSGVETMVGLLINTLPMRVRVSETEPLIPWLQKLQEHQFEVRQYEYSALIDVQGWSE
ncbi:MAG: condensation domain-containing protein, partial [Pyrinomonadaceae bacterium]